MAPIFSSIEEQGLALVGNPGAGKSTILNGIAGGSVFKSGISLGSGLTTVLQQHKCEGNLTLFDTPGLADIEKRKQAGKEIDKALQTNMSIKLAFVVTLEKGRVRPDDAATIKVVLQAIKSVDVKNRFGVIINQLTAGEARALQEDLDSAARVRKGLTGAFYTSHWIYLLNMTELEDAKDAKLMTDDLLNFFAGLPDAKPPGAKVDDIDTSDLDEKIEQQRQFILELQAANAAEREEMQRQLELQRQEADARVAEVRETLAQLDGQLRRARAGAEKQSYKLQRILYGIWNTAALSGGAAVSLVLAHPAPMIAAAAMCRKASKPKP